MAYFEQYLSKPLKIKLEGNEGDGNVNRGEKYCGW
jgi:hypothetical protein